MAITSLLDAAIDVKTGAGAAQAKYTDTHIPARVLAKGTILRVRVVTTGGGATSDLCVVLYFQDAPRAPGLEFVFPQIIRALDKHRADGPIFTMTFTPPDHAAAATKDYVFKLDQRCKLLMVSASCSASTQTTATVDVMQGTA